MNVDSADVIALMGCIVLCRAKTGMLAPHSRVELRYCIVQAFGEGRL